MRRKSIHLICSHLSESRISVIVIMVQVVVTVVVFNVFWSDFEKLMTRNDLYQSLGLQNLACITVSDSDDEILMRINQTHGMTLLGENFHSFDFYCESSDETVELCPVSYGYTQYFDSAISKGSWKLPDSSEKAVAAVVPRSMAGKYRMGETYRLYDIAGSGNMDVYISGVLSDDSIFIPPSGSDANMLMVDMSSQMLVCCGESDNAADTLFGDDVHTSVYTIATQDKESLDAFSAQTDLEKYFYMSVGSAKDEDDSIILHEMGIPLVITVIMSILCIANFSSYSLLSVIKREKEYTIYYICGSTWRECLRMQIVEDLLIAALPFIISVFLCDVLSMNGIGGQLSIKGMLFSLLLCTVIMRASSFAALMRLKKCSPIEIIRR